MQVTFLLTGVRAGRTVKLARDRYHFKEGRWNFEGSPKEFEGVSAQLIRYYACVVEGSNEHKALVAELAGGTRGGKSQPSQSVGETGKGEVQSANTPTTPPAGSSEAGTGDASTSAGATDAAASEGDSVGASATDSVNKALDALDPENEDHWTGTGLPKMSAVSKELPAGVNVTRGELDDVRPGFDRDKAREANEALKG